MPDVADHAYAHACALLGPGEPALGVAVDAVRRGGRSRWAVLGHARAGALTSTDGDPAPELDTPAPEDLGAFALALAGTRPPIERAVVDLDTRHDLDRGGFARALGLPAPAAGARAAEVFLLWEQTLDPVVLARLGPADCEGLALLLGVRSASVDAEVGAEGGRPPDDRARSLRELVELGPWVGEHVAGCAACRDRLRAMVSVRTLVGRRPLEVAPPAVRAAASSSRLRRSIPPPPLQPAGPGRRRLRPVVPVTLALGLALAGGVVAADRRTGPAPATSEALTQVPLSGSSLEVQPSAVSGPLPPPVLLENRSDATVPWEAQPDVPWLLVEPRRGTLAPGATARIHLAVSGEVPEGDARGAVRFSGADGSVTEVRVTATVERPPDVAAMAQGCDVTATVEDEGQVRSVELHRRDPDGTERSTAMDAGASGYSGRLPTSPAPLVWWVTAVDARGNESRTADQTLPADACP